MDQHLIMTLAGGLAAACAAGLLMQRLRVSPIVGYLLAGIAVGPFTPGFVAHSDIANQLAEVGIILLMFGVGLQFHVEELLAVRKVAVPGAALGIVAATTLGAGIGFAAGWGVAGSLVFGVTIAIASTVVLLRVLSDHEMTQTPIGHVAVGWLVVEDLFTVVVLVIVPSLSSGHHHPAEVLGALALSVIKIIALVALVMIGGRRLLPRLLAYVAKTRSRELFTLTILVVALGVAVLAANLFGASMAIGAFLGGMVIGQSEFGARAASEALPMRDAFAVLFFVSVGMLFDPSQLLPNAGLIAASIFVLLIAKPAVAWLLLRKRSLLVALPVAASLAQIGEFSFLIANAGIKAGFLPQRVLQVLVVSAVVTIAANPFLFRFARSLAERLRSSEPGDVMPLAFSRRRDPSHFHSIVVGYGPVGQTVTRVLRENGITPTVVELNHESILELQAKGIDSVYGDATQRTILEEAGIREAKSFIFAAQGSSGLAVIKLARELNPNVTFVARSNFIREALLIADAGAHRVIVAEVEVAIAMAEHILTELGATPEQLDRARERTRTELRPDDTEPQAV